MHNRRPRTSLTLIVLGILLLASVFIGQRIGDRALFGSTERRNPAVVPLPTPVAEASLDPSVSRNWKRLQIVSVATDPAFPDPRVTPPPPTPSPTARSRASDAAPGALTPRRRSLIPLTSPVPGQATEPAVRYEQ